MTRLKETKQTVSKMRVSKGQDKRTVSWMFNRLIPMGEGEDRVPSTIPFFYDKDDLYILLFCPVFHAKMKQSLASSRICIDSPVPHTYNCLKLVDTPLKYFSVPVVFPSSLSLLLFKSSSHMPARV